MNGLQTMSSLDRPLLILFGGTGDLTFRKLLPALYNLDVTKKLDDAFQVIIIGRQPFTSASYHEKLEQWVKDNARIPFSETDYQSFIKKVEYFKMDFNETEGFPRLKAYLATLDPEQTRDRLYYLAVAPSSFNVIAHHLDEGQLIENKQKNTVIIEKPFGDDLKSAKHINDVFESVFDPERIYRIDHYLAKEMVQNILTIRFANTIFEGIWNNQFIDNIQISATEIVGVEGRGNYYDHSGAIKDMVQNHLLQLLSFVTMERPLSNQAHDIHQAQFDLLKHIHFPFDEGIHERLVLGQYAVEIPTEENKSYRDEQRVRPDSKTETYVAMQLEIDNDRFRGVPIFLRTGKKLHKRTTEIAIEFKAKVYNGELMKKDVLLIKVQPDEGIYFKFNIKKPGQGYEIESAFMDFCQSCIYENRINTPEAYERLLFAAMENDGSLFTSWEIAQNNWAFIEQLVSAIDQQQVQLQPYESYSEGPQATQDMLAKHQTNWVEEKVLGDLYGQ